MKQCSSVIARKDEKDRFPKTNFKIQIFVCRISCSYPGSLSWILTFHKCSWSPNWLSFLILFIKTIDETTKRTESNDSESDEELAYMNGKRRIQNMAKSHLLIISVLCLFFPKSRDYRSKVTRKSKIFIILLWGKDWLVFSRNRLKFVRKSWIWKTVNSLCQ